MSSSSIAKCYIAFAVAESQWYKVFTTMDHSKVVKFKQEHNEGKIPFAVLYVTYVMTNKEVTMVEPTAVGVDEVCNACILAPTEILQYFLGFVKQGPPEQIEWIRTLKTTDEGEMMAFYDDKVKAKHSYAIVTSKYRESSDGIYLPIDSIELHSAYDPKPPPPPCPSPSDRRRL